MKMKYLFLSVFLVFAIGAACQKAPVPTFVNENNVSVSPEVVDETCNGTPSECFARCTKIPDPLQKEICYVTILNEQTKDFCGQIDDDVLCNDFFVWQASVNVNDCEQISTDLWKKRCLESFGDTQIFFNQADFDGDGLSNEEEISLGTDFRKFDTDGDGHSDYDEVKEGYDPLTPSRK